jgi:hypothetical protein
MAWSHATRSRPNSTSLTSDVGIRLPEELPVDLHKYLIVK